MTTRPGSDPFTAGVDLGGTKIETVVMQAGTVIGQARAATPQTGAEDVAEPLGDLCRPFVSEVGDRLQVVAEDVDHNGQIHDDITMTSQTMSVKCHQDTQPASTCHSQRPQSRPRRP